MVPLASQSRCFCTVLILEVTADIYKQCWAPSHRMMVSCRCVYFMQFSVKLNTCGCVKLLSFSSLWSCLHLPFTSVLCDLITSGQAKQITVYLIMKCLKRTSCEHLWLNLVGRMSDFVSHHYFTLRTLSNFNRPVNGSKTDLLCKYMCVHSTHLHFLWNGVQLLRKLKTKGNYNFLAHNFDFLQMQFCILQFSFLNWELQLTKFAIVQELWDKLWTARNKRM